MKNTKKALFTSALCLLLCFSMLIGTTFAWFTDEVTTGMNIIAAGNLDVELLADGVEVDSSTKLFDDVVLWEPGAVAYENLKVVNEGTLALKYRLKLNFGKENVFNGHKLSEVLKIAIIDKVADNATRQDVLKAAKEAVAADKGLGALSNFYVNGTLLPGASSDEKTVVIFWEPTDHDNDYNVNNGQSTSDGEPLHIEFGVTLEASQMMHENDSFGNDYDDFASLLPQATVNNLGAKQYNATEGIGGPDIVLDMPFTMQFLPNEQLTDPDGVPDSGDEYLDSAYRYWHADYVVKADNDVPADSMALGGYYQAWCGPKYEDGSGWNLNDGKWVALTSDQDIAANTEIRLVQAMGNGAITVNYEEICKFGNDGIGFLCGAVDLTGVNAGTTLTVELRLYETTIDPSANSGSANIETGNFITVGTYSYTFGAKNAAGLQAALAAGNPEIKLDSDIVLADNEVLKVTGNTVIDLNGHTISGKSTTSTTSYMINVASGAELTLSGNGTVSFYATTPDTEWGGVGQPPYPGYANNTIRCEGKLIIDGVTVENLTAPGGASYAIDCYQGSDLIVNSGVINGHGKCAIRMFCNSNTLSTNVTINGGTITGKRAIWVQLPGSNIANERPVNLTINGGKLICTNTDADVCVYSYSYGDSFANTNITITGGEFIGDVCFGGGNAKTTQENVTITGGTFNGELGRYLANDGWEDIAKP